MASFFEKWEAVIRRIPLKSAKLCSACGGSGKEHVCGMVCVDLDNPCPACKGTGRAS